MAALTLAPAAHPGLQPANGGLQGGPHLTPSGRQPKAISAPSPDSAVKRLIGSIDTLLLQQERSEAARHAAETAAAEAAAEAAELQAQLHAALRSAAELDDREQAVQAALDARLQEQARRAEQLMLARRQLSALRGESSTSSGEEELLQKQALAADLQARLVAGGMDEATLAQLCLAAAHSTVAGDNSRSTSAAHPAGQAGQQQQQQQPGLDGRRRASWLGGGASSTGLLASFRRRGSAAG